MLKKLVLLFSLFFLCVAGMGEEEGAAAEKSYPEFGLSAEAGIALAGGNTRSNTLTAKSDAKWTWEKDVLKGFGHYFLNNASSTPGGNLTKNGENWNLGARWERTISGNFGVYVGNNWLGDKFAGYSYRTNLDAGAQYYFIPGDRKENYWVGELGYRFTYENNENVIGAASVTSSEAHAIRIYTEAGKRLTSAILAKVWVEVLPDVSNGTNLLINFEPSLNVTLNSNFALKLAFLGKYDGLPAVAGNKTFDYLYTTSLVATF